MNGIPESTQNREVHPYDLIRGIYEVQRGMDKQDFVKCMISIYFDLDGNYNEIVLKCSRKFKWTNGVALKSRDV